MKIDVVVSNRTTVRVHTKTITFRTGSLNEGEVEKRERKGDEPSPL